MKNLIQYIQHKLNGFFSPPEISALTRLIFSEVCQLSLADIVSDKTIIVSDLQQQQIETIIHRLQKNEPIQYIIGATEFYGLPFCVTPDVLIPRPETEELVEWILEEIGNADDADNADFRGKLFSQYTDIQKQKIRKNPCYPHHLRFKISILDIGTGSGCIPITLAKKRPDAHVSAWDISEKAIAVAVENARQNNVNVQFMQQDVFAPFSLDTAYDIIVSNPPYVLDSEKEKMCKNVLNFEPYIALFVPNDNPLLFYDCIADIALKLLTPNGKLYFEINRDKGDAVSTLLQQKGFTAIELRRDISGNNRMIRAQKK